MRTTNAAGRLVGAGLVGAFCLAACGSMPTARPVVGTLSANITPNAAVSRSLQAAAKDSPTNWLSYHFNDSRTAAVPADKALNNPHRVWSRNLGGVVHGQVVASGGRLFAATENNRVVALNPANGHVIWSRSLGKPLTDVPQRAGCGDIDPLGVTSTPVIDPKAGLIYVVAEVAHGSGVSHKLSVLSLKSGKIERTEDVDPKLPSGESTIHLLQRASLAFANGRIYIPYGGNDGDCGVYHGWVVSVSASGGKPAKKQFEVASDGQGGAIWEAGGAPAVASNGDLYVSTGNANPDPPQGGPDPKKYTESVVKLSPTLQPLAAYKDKIAGGDEDLATGNPVLLPGGLVFAIGKTDVGYVLKQSNLHKVAAISGICGSDPDGGPAYDAKLHTMFVPCKDGGVQAVNLKTKHVGQKLSGANSAPILIGQQLVATVYPDGTLYVYNAETKKLEHSVSTGTTVPNFASPSVADGLILLDTNSGVTAFR